MRPFGFRKAFLKFEEAFLCPGDILRMAPLVIQVHIGDEFEALRHRVGAFANGFPRRSSIVMRLLSAAIVRVIQALFVADDHVRQAVHGLHKLRHALVRLGGALLVAPFVLASALVRRRSLSRC